MTSGGEPPPAPSRLAGEGWAEGAPDPAPPGPPARPRGWSSAVGPDLRPSARLESRPESPRAARYWASPPGRSPPTSLSRIGHDDHQTDPLDPGGGRRA